MPALVPVTLAVIVHEPLGATVPPIKLIVLEPAVAVTVPPQAPITLGGFATTSPPGKASLKAAPVSEASGFGLMMVKLRLVVALSWIWALPKLLLIDGAPLTATILVQVLLQPLLLFVTVTVRV